MSTFLRFRFGPFVSYQRLGRTQAQKRAAAKAAGVRREARRSRGQVLITMGTVTGCGPGRVTVRAAGPRGDLTHFSRRSGSVLTLATDETFPVGLPVEVRERERDGKLLAIWPVT